MAKEGVVEEMNSERVRRCGDGGIGHGEREG